MTNKRFWTRFASGLPRDEIGPYLQRCGWRLATGATAEDAALRVAYIALQRQHVYGTCHAIVVPAVNYIGRRSLPWREPHAALWHAITLNIKNVER